MSTEELQNYKFYVSLGYVVLLAALLTIITMQIYKTILKKRKILTQEMDKDKKDNILSKSGRIIALVIYTIFYLINEYYTKNKIILDETLLVGLLSGSAATLTIAKGIYTSIRQYQKKRNIFDKLVNAEQTIATLQEEAIKKQNKIILKRKEEN